MPGAGPARCGVTGAVRHALLAWGRGARGSNPSPSRSQKELWEVRVPAIGRSCGSLQKRRRHPWPMDRSGCPLVASIFFPTASDRSAPRNPHDPRCSAQRRSGFASWISFVLWAGGPVAQRREVPPLSGERGGGVRGGCGVFGWNWRWVSESRHGLKEASYTQVEDFTWK